MKNPSLLRVIHIKNQKQWQNLKNSWNSCINLWKWNTFKLSRFWSQRYLLLLSKWSSKLFKLEMTGAVTSANRFFTLCLFTKSLNPVLIFQTVSDKENKCWISKLKSQELTIQERLLWQASCRPACRSWCLMVSWGQGYFGCFLSPSPQPRVWIALGNVC